MQTLRDVPLVPKLRPSLVPKLCLGTPTGRRVPKQSFGTSVVLSLGTRLMRATSLPLLLISCLLTTTAAAQTIPTAPQPACANGRCRIAPAQQWQPAPVQPRPSETTREVIHRATGYCRLRVVESTRSIRYGSAVSVGRGRSTNEWTFLSAGHIFTDLDESARIELDIRGDWLPARVLAHDTSPDRAILLLRTELQLRTTSIAQHTTRTGPCVMIGYPRGGKARAFLGHVSECTRTKRWLRLERTSHFDCLNGTSGGGVYDAQGALIGIQSCTNGRGTVTEIGFTPVAAWDALFAQLGWTPQGWRRGESSPQIAAPQQGPRGPQGERGPAGPPGPEVTPQQIEQALAAYLAQHPPQVDQQHLEAAIAKALQSQTPAVELAPIQRRLETIEQRIEEPFEVQLFNAGTKVGSPRSVHPHGGYLPLDVFGEIETLAGPSKGE